MQQNLTPRYLIIGVILAWGIYTLWPSWQYQNMSDEKKEELRESGDLKTIESKIIRQGLDLKGGMYIVLEADIPTLMKNLATNRDDRFDAVLNKTVEKFNFLDTEFFTVFRQEIESSKLKPARYYHEYGSSLDEILSGLEEEANDAINRVLEILQNRVDQFGVSEPTIQKQGQHRILVELAGIQDSERARSLLQSTALLEFYLVKNAAVTNEILIQLDDLLKESTTEEELVELTKSLQKEKSKVETEMVDDEDDDESITVDEIFGDTETILMINDEYPKAVFNSEGQLGFTGSWIVDIKMSNIIAKNSEEQIWDSEELVFTNKNYRVEVFEPPNLSLTQFTANRVDIGEGEAVTFTIVISNDGEAEATGNVQILQSGSVVGTTSFTAPGYDSIAVTYDWSVPGNYDGEVNLKAQIDPNSVNPPGGPEDRVTDDFQTLTLNVEGTVNVKPASESGTGTGALIVPLIVFVVLIAGLGGAYLMYRRSQPSAEETDSFGDMGGLPEQTPMAAPQPEQPPVAPPPPQPEQPPVAAPPQGTLLSITVPEGAQPGQQIQIKAPDGRVVAVTIPAGMQPGTQFQVKI